MDRPITLEDLKEVISFERDQNGKIILTGVNCDIAGDFHGVHFGNHYGVHEGDHIGYHVGNHYSVPKRMS